MIDVPHRHASFGDFRLESGEVIHDFTLSYVGAPTCTLTLAMLTPAASRTMCR